MSALSNIFISIARTANASLRKFRQKRLIMLAALTLSAAFAPALFFAAPLAANNNVFERNGEVYVMIGSGSRMGVYANQTIDAAGNRTIVSPDGLRLFPAPERIEAMNDYMSLAVDQFRNIYVLAGKCDPGLIDPPVDFYWPVDPPRNEGVIGIGTDPSGEVFHDVINYIPGSPTSAHGKPDPSVVKQKANSPCYYDGGVDRGRAPSPPADVLSQYAVKYPGVSNDQFRRIREGYWYPGFYPSWNNHSTVFFGRHRHYQEGIGGGNWQRRWGFKIQRVSLWIAHYVQSVPPGTQLPSYISPGIENPLFEQVFKTTNMQFNFQRASACAENYHPGSIAPTQATVTTNYRLGFSTTGAGRRYVYSSLPDPVIKRGSIQMVAGNKYGIPLNDSTVYGGMIGYGGSPRSPGFRLTRDVCKIGAATKNSSEDWVYAAPVTEDGYDVIDFCVADQWDGLGGITFRLLQQPGEPNRLFSPRLEKKLKWNKFSGYEPAGPDPGGITSGNITLPADVKCIAADGGGSLYYLTEAKPILDGSSKAGLTYDCNDPSRQVFAPVACPPEEGKPLWKWFRKYKVRAVAELYQIEFYTKTSTKINEYTVGSEDVMVMEVFGDAAGNNLVSRGIPEVVGPKVADIKLGLAVINLAGPPVGNNERHCSDIYTTVSAARNRKEITYTEHSAGGAFNLKKVEGDVATEDERYQCVMENAPPQFSNDLVRKNTNSGTRLKDLNGNGVTGGFLYSVRPGTATYYWKVEMLDPMKKVIKPDLSFTGSSTGGGTVTLAAARKPDGWDALMDKGARSGAVSFDDGSWFMSAGPNAWKRPQDEDPAAGEAPPDLAFTPTEPGVYRISLIACAKCWDYDKMPYPSYITDRNNYKQKDFKFLFFDDGGSKGSGGKKGNGIKDGDEDYVAERYIVVEAKKAEPDKYITGIKIEGPQTVDENKVCVWSATASVRYVKSFKHEAGGIGDKQLMETYNGIGVWDYEPECVSAAGGARSWGLPAYDGVGEDFVRGAPAKPPNCFSGAGGSGTIEAALRNFGEIPPGGIKIQPPPYVTAANAPVWGTSPGTALWIEGAGTTSNPEKPLNIADRGAIEYEWYAAGERLDDGGGKTALGCETIDGRSVPAILIARGRLSDEAPFPKTFTGTNGENAVRWVGGYKNRDRRFQVKVNLRYAFDTPLAPGKYFLYIKFRYPKLKWEGRSPKKDENGAEARDTAGDPIYAYYDLVPDGYGETSYNAANWAEMSDGSAPAGFAVTVNDRQPPQAYFSAGDAAADPDPASALPEGSLPKTGVIFRGATTGDPFPFDINYTVCDNNPNCAIPSAYLKALLGRNTAELRWKDANASKLSDSQMDFTRDKLKTALESTIDPPAAGKPPGTIQDAVEIPLAAYPGYGASAPYRKASYRLAAPSPNAMRATAFGGNDIPYDMTGSLPMYVAGEDAAGNVIGNCKCSPGRDTSEIEAKVRRTDGLAGDRRREYANAPAVIPVKDNDPPTVIFRALQPRDSAVRVYTVRQTGAITDPTTGMPSDDASYHDVLDPDDARGPGKLRFSSLGAGTVRVHELKLDGSPAAIAGRNSPLLADTAIPGDGLKCRTLDADFRGDAILGPGLFEGAPGYVIKFAACNTGLTNIYDDYSPACVSYYDFDAILTGSGADTLEITENSRTRFEISAADNADGPIAPSLCVGGPSMAGYNTFVGTDNLGDRETLQEVMSGWKLNSKKDLETSGIFRTATPAGNPPPHVLIAVKDSSGNATVVRVRLTVPHTFMQRETIDTETRRGE